VGPWGADEMLVALARSYAELCPDCIQRPPAAIAV
jgi:hypothetical protein